MPITLINGHLQTAQALAVPNGSINFQLNVDATVVAAPFGYVAADAVVNFQLDADGDILPPTGAAAAQIYSNAELNPQNSVGLGTYYLVTFYDQNGARLNKNPMWWQFTEAADATVDIGEMIPFATIGGNVIFYPTSLAIPAPGPSSLGGVFSNVGVAHEWVSAINTDGSVTLTQPNFTDIAGTLTNAQLPNPITFTTITASGLITAQANLQLGVVSSQTGIITFEGGTSGAATITGPAVAGTATNAFAFSNSINLPSGTAYTFNTDTGISRISAGVLAVGNGTAADFSGTIKATTLILAGKLSTYDNIATAGQGTAPIYAAASQTSQTGAATILTYTPPAVAGSYRIRFVIAVATASSAVVGWTATWTDSQGNAQTPTNLSLFEAGTAAPALTFTTSAGSNATQFYGHLDIDINNAAANIVVKFTLASGTVAAKVTATIEQII